LRSSEDQVLAIAGLNVDGALSVQIKQGTDFATMNATTGCFNHNRAANELDWDLDLQRLDWDWGWDLLLLDLDLLLLDWDLDWDWDGFFFDLDGLLHNVCRFFFFVFLFLVQDHGRFPYLQMGALNGNATALYLVSVRVLALLLLLLIDDHCSS
jgi:hypothetical protein